MTQLPRITGDERVDRALAGLADLERAPVSAHVAAFEGLYASLEGVLAAAEEPGERGQDGTAHPSRPEREPEAR
ncbi:hypothetical protein [Thermostaphylospora chromogena]|nr:hypothetical protein [Thermostaphylospora chromogena]